MTYSIKKARYDAQNDILYIHFTGIGSSTYAEEEDGILILRDYATDEIVGVTVFDPKTQTQKREKELCSFGLDVAFRDCLM